MARTAKDPASAIQQMSANNPQMQQVLQYIQQNGGNPKAAFDAYVRQNGISQADAQNAINQAQGSMKY